ncbi:Oidioi.mRNA.OKI2018_I69.chr1.g3036.t1.cds [Oikopleura dioica]|uniref:Oidioi.mRNA.OKI2018_I69.chr1.g3036.t1.cds n=1 Tax=Oikopleura dioica TaxID=34765 RepID=A0ABN7SSY9_OIKDI|nr:Oidioi.mRNA.OKI2018_I69.chr1.g3036.t1.cds [Oikopleura dioica]
MEMLQGLPLSENEAEIISKVMNSESAPLEALVITAAGTMIDLAKKELKWARHAALLASMIIEKENGQYKDEPKRPFRTRTLGLLQKTFKDKANLKPSEFRGFVAYICGLYKTIRVKGQELGVLVTPVFQCLEQLTLSGEQNDIQCLMGQLQLIGQQLETANNEKMDKLFTCIRDCFINPNTSSAGRRMLLEIIEVRAGRWCLSTAAYEYYYCQKVQVKPSTEKVENFTSADEEMSRMLKNRRAQSLERRSSDESRRTSS